MSKKNINRNAIAALILFFTLVAIGFIHEAKSAEFEIGPTFLSGDFAEGGLLVFSERITPKWDVYMGYISEQVVQTCNRADAIPPYCRFTPRENLFVGVNRVVAVPLFDMPLELGFGPAYFQNINRAIGCKFSAGLSIKWLFNEHFNIGVRHWSNGGSCSPNLGQDAFTFGWRF